jgi:hypothetical protein
MSKNCQRKIVFRKKFEQMHKCGRRTNFGEKIVFQDIVIELWWNNKGQRKCTAMEGSGADNLTNTIDVHHEFFVVGGCRQR